jgi:D-glycero-beta-D-manno-heptose 1-phosphate adenylyltransferase
VNSSAKVLARSEALRWVRARRSAGARVVLTNGVFDLLHLGHVRYLQQARTLGDALVVAVNSDASTRRLKGPKRPLVPEQERAEVLAGLECVDAVTIFDEDTAGPLVEALRPDIYVKGGDYAGPDAPDGMQMIGPEELRRLVAGADAGEEAPAAFFRRLPEARVVATYGGTVCLIPYLPGRSTTALIERIVSVYGH